MSGAETSGGDLGRAATAFADAAGQIRAQVGNVAASTVTPGKAGRKFSAAGTAYQNLMQRLGDNVRLFAERGTQLSGDFGESAEQYQSSDQDGADRIRGVEA